MQVKNERISLALLPEDKELLSEAKEFILTALGTTGMDETVYNPGPSMMGISFTAVTFQGKFVRGNAGRNPFGESGSGEA